MGVTTENTIKDNTHFDELTGIYNQQSFFECTAQMLSEHPEQSFCLIYWNIRKFRTTNDLFGREAGNQILIHWANTLREILQDELAVYARLDHDNFICCVPEQFLEKSDWTKLGEISYYTEETEYHFYSCCGLYKIIDRTLSLSTMIDKARAAMETIKNNYMTLYAWYDESMWTRLLEEQRMNMEFKTAIVEKQFKVYYQPICRSSDGLITSAEALIRWQHPTKGMISPGAFIPLFEKNGFISTLDRYVWDEVCSMQQSRLDQGLATVPVSVNVSRVEFYNPSLCDDIRNIAKKHNLSPDLLKIEITESAYADNPVQVLEAVKKLHTYGFSVLMDDFGSGYSSLNMLKDLPIDVLKIDMRFLDDLEKSKKASIVLESIIRLAKWMKLSVVSEGVETQKEWEYLRSVECDAVQGYYFYRPMPQEDFIALLDKSATNSTNLLFHASPELDDSILDIFNQSSTVESVLFYSMLGGMGLLEVCGDSVELLRVNRGFYEVLYGYASFDRRVLNMQFPEEEQLILLEQCHIAREDSKIQQFQLHHQLDDGTRVWLSIKLRYFGGASPRSLFLIAIDNIDEWKRAEQEQYINHYSTVLLKLFDRVYRFDYKTDIIELLHSRGEDFIQLQTQYSFASFFQHLAAVTSPDELEKLNIIRNQPVLDETLAQTHETCLTVPYELSSNGKVTNSTAYFFKAELPNGESQYLCCVKKQN